MVYPDPAVLKNQAAYGDHYIKSTIPKSKLKGKYYSDSQFRNFCLTACWNKMHGNTLVLRKWPCFSGVIMEMALRM